MCRIPRIRVREIILLTEIKKDDAAQKARMIFFFSQVGEKKQPISIGGTVTNRPFQRAHREVGSQRCLSVKSFPESHCQSARLI